MEISVDTKSEAMTSAEEAKVEVDNEKQEQGGTAKQEPTLEVCISNPSLWLSFLGLMLCKRFIGTTTAIAFEVLVQASWETLATTFQFSLLNGGPSSMVYGGILAGFGGTAIALSLGEMASMCVFLPTV
jgi:hypothetical protein